MANGVTEGYPSEIPTENSSGQDLSTLQAQQNLILSPEEEQWLKANPVIRLLGSLNLEPAYILEPNGNVSGIIPDIMEKCSAILHHPISVELFTPSEVLAKLKDPQYHGISSIMEIPSLERPFELSSSYLNTSFSVFTKRSRVSEFQEGADLIGRKVATLRGVPALALYLNHIGVMDIEEVARPLDQFTMLMSGQVDAIIGYFSHQYFINKLNLTDVSMAFVTPEAQHVCVAVSEHHPILKGIINKAIEQLNIVDRLSILTKWFGFNKHIMLSNSFKFTPEESNYLIIHPEIQVAIDQNYPPFSYVLGDKVFGYDVDLLKKITELSGLRFKFSPGQWKENLDEFRGGKVDMISNISFNEERKSYTLFTKPYYEVPLGIFARKDFGKYNGLSSLQGKVIGVVKDVWFVEKLHELHPKEIVTFTDNEIMLKALSFGHLDVVIRSFPSTNFTAQNMGLTNIVPIGEYQVDNRAKEDLRFGVNPQSPFLYTIIEKCLGQIDENIKNELRNRWIGTPTEIRNDLLSSKEKKIIQKYPHLVISIDHAQHPFTIWDKAGNFSGMLKDTHAAIFQETDCTLSYRIQSAQGSPVQDAITLRGDAFAEEDSNYAYTKPYLSLPLSIVGRLDASYIEGIESLAYEKVAVIREHYSDRYIRSHFPDVERIVFDTEADALNAVLKGELDYYVDHLVAIKMAIQKEGLDGIKIIGKSKQTVKIVFGVPLGCKELVPLLNKMIEAVPEVIQAEIYQKWAGIDIEEKVDYQLVWQVVGVAVMILLIVGYWNRKLIKEIEKGKNTEQELILAEERANLALQYKSDFIANVSHEIRTPMNAILGMNTMALETGNDDKRRRYISNALGASKLLLKMINDILDFSKIASGKMQLDLQLTCLPQLLNEMVELFQLTAEQKGIDMKLEIEETTPEYILCDTLKLSQILTNLLSNALKFTEKGMVKLSCSSFLSTSGKRWLQMEVSDTGKGIDPQKVDQIFKPFTQEDGSISRRFGGTGLGLTITKNLVELMGGKLQVESQLDIGTKIIISLDVEVRAPQDTVLSPLCTDLYYQAKVLVVEDNNMNREVAQYFLSQIVSTVELAEDGYEAIEKITSQKDELYDLIFMDIQMPKMNGFEATRQIQENSNWKKIPIIAMTANAMEADVQACLKAGMSGHVAKPYDLETLRRIIQRWIGEERRIEKQELFPKKTEENVETVHKVPSLNVEDLLERLQGNQAIAKKILEMYLQSYEEKKNEVCLKIEEGNLAGAQFVLHTWKGMALSIGSQKLHGVLQSMEMDMKAGVTPKADTMVLMEKIAQDVSLDIQNFIQEG